MAHWISAISISAVVVCFTLSIQPTKTQEHQGFFAGTDYPMQQNPFEMNKNNSYWWSQRIVYACEKRR